jgi:hypothetical protein
MKTSRAFTSFALTFVVVACLHAADAPAPASPAAVPVPAPAAAPATPPAVTATAAATKAPAPPPISPRFQQVRNRIDALFHNRTSSPAPLDPKQNPFRPAGVFIAPVVASDGKITIPVVEQPASDEIVLRDAAATLKIGGVFEFGTKQHRVVNGRPYKEGDVIPAQVQGQTIYLRIKALTPKSLTLVLKEAELTLNF